MQYDQTIITPKGLIVHIRNGVTSDGSAVLENFDLTHAETDYLLSYPDENHFDAEQESRYLEKKETSPNEIELIAFVDGKVAGTAGIDAIGAQYKVTHRAEFGVSILKEYWGLASLDGSLYPLRQNRRICSVGAGGSGGERKSNFHVPDGRVCGIWQKPKRFSLSERWISGTDLHAAGIVELID